SQTGNAQPAMIACPDLIDAESYTFKIQARKNAGLEGFMAMFGYKNPDNYMWYNVGGWGNSQNNVEQAIDGNRVPLCREQRFSVDPGRWYDLQVDVNGDSIRCYLDGRLDLECKALAGSAMEGVFASTTIDDAAKIMYVKVVNLGDGHADGIVNLANCAIDTDRHDALQLIRLSAENGNEENSIPDPHHIYPTPGNVRAGNAGEVLFDVPAYSVNIIKIALK
ncbi:MAG: hypothetical protein K2F72_01905, partial [Muribaculaceae bacterium]|nr:hypothetical protein [Muribaculaceae bacterium]